MKKTKRSIALVMAAIMLCGILAGCGGESDVLH